MTIYDPVFIDGKCYAVRACLHCGSPRVRDHGMMAGRVLCERCLYRTLRSWSGRDIQTSDPWVISAMFIVRFP